MTESKVLSEVLKQLKSQEFSGGVVWYQRMQSLQMGTIRIGRVGTPDVLAILNNYDGTITAMFIECKASNVNKKRDREKLPVHQREFFKSMDGKPKTYCCIINDPKQLAGEMKKARGL